MWKPRARWRSAISCSSLSRTKCRKSRCSHELRAKTKGRAGGALASGAQRCGEDGSRGPKNARMRIHGMGGELKNRSSASSCRAWNEGTSRHKKARRRMRSSMATSRSAASCSCTRSASSAADLGRRGRTGSQSDSSSESTATRDFFGGGSDLGVVILKFFFFSAVGVELAELQERG